MELEFGQTSKGRECVYHEGYEYQKLRMAKSGVVTWVCVFKYSKKCYSSIQSKDNILTRGPNIEHQCGVPVDVRIEVSKRVQGAVKRAREEDASVSQIYNNAMGDLHDKASQHQLTPVPSTSGVVPKPSAITAPSQPSAKPYVPVQSDVRPSPPVVPKPLSVPEPEPLPHAEDDSSISVKWNTYATNMSSVMPSLLEDEKFVDVTLACDGKYIKCHKVILGACSAYFEELLSANPCQHPIILMRDFQFWEIQAIVDFIYRGVVNIQQHKLPKLLQVASILQIKGLTGATSDTGSNPDDSKPFGSNPDDSKPTEHSRKSQLEGSGAMRKRPKFPPGPGIKTSESPVKKMKLIRISSGKPLEPNMSDESSSQSDGHSTSLSHSSEPYSLLHSVSIKEESLDYDVDDPSHNLYSYDENVVESGGTSKLGQFQLLTLPESGAIKEETSDELFNPTYEDPLEPESGVS